MRQTHCNGIVRRLRWLEVIVSLLAVTLPATFHATLPGSALQAAEAGPSGGGEPNSDVRFVIEPVTDDPEQLACQFTDEQIALLEKLNRADRAHLPRLGEIVVPDRWDLEERVYSPLPAAWPAATDIPKVLLLSQPHQVFGAYERGELVYWGPISSGRKSQPTPAGLFFLNWKSPGRRSTVNASWFLPWYFNFINARGISFHQFELPGRPESHGCVRLLARDARWIYGWGDEWLLDSRGWTVEKEGTPVLIAGQCDYSARAPWHAAGHLAVQRSAVLQSIAVPDAMLAKLRQPAQLASETTVAKGAGTMVQQDPERLEVTNVGPMPLTSRGF